MCNLDVNQISFEENCLTKTTTTSQKLKSVNIFKNNYCNSSNLENIINTSRMIIMMDYTKNRPRKIILDTKCDNSRLGLNRNKETQRLSEIVFGNFSLSSKANGFKLHIIKNPSEMIVSKLFNIPFNSIFYEFRSVSRKISPDSGNTQSSSSNSSHNSNLSLFSSYHSNPSSIVNHVASCHEKIDLASPVMSSIRNSSCNTISTTSQFSSNNKNNSGSFFNENFESYHQSTIMISIIFTFSIPEENRAEFEEFIFHYYVLLESILNRLSQLIYDNCHSIYNGNVVKCWKQSKKWLISLLPRHIPEIYNCSIQSNCSKPVNISNNLINIQCFEEVLEYFDKQKQINFLAEIITGVLMANQNCSLKFFREPSERNSKIFPYTHILQNLGINTDKHTFNRIIVKGVSKDHDQTSSWKDKFSSSLSYYKKILNNSIVENRSSDSKINKSCRPKSINVQVRSSNNSLNVSYKDVEMLTKFIAYLIRPVTTIAYQLHIIPSESVINKAKPVQLDGNKTAIEIPLLNDGMMLDKEVLPQINELFYPNKIVDRIFSSITPLQGLLIDPNHYSDKMFSDQIAQESRQSEIAYNNQIFHPDFLVIDTETSIVKIQKERVLASAWVEKVLIDIVSLTKVAGYCSAIGDLYLISALSDFSSKARICRDYFISKKEKTINPWFITKYGLSESDLALVLSICN